ncbi:MAG: hypothetical protein WAS21_22830 [Geminicoccaceae bacterium]
MMRSSIERVTFRHDFLLKGVDTAQPPGTYEIETDDEPLPGLSFMAYRRVSTAIRIPSGTRGSTSSQTFPISPHDLETALARDSQPEAASCA